MTTASAGFVFTLDTIVNGIIVDRETVHNLMPTEAANYLINAGIKASAPYTSWYIGLYAGSYTPVAGDTMAAFPALAGELVDFSEATRRPLVLGIAANGQVHNRASQALFTGTVNGTLALGGFISSSAIKNSTAGLLLSAVHFPSPKPLGAGVGLRVTCGFALS